MMGLKASSGYQAVQRSSSTPLGAEKMIAEESIWIYDLGTYTSIPACKYNLAL